MIIDISAGIDQEAFGNVIKAYNSLLNDEILEIYLNSSGGDPDIGNAIVDTINNNLEKTILIGYGKIFSAAFDLFYKAKCSKRLLDGILGMAHLARIEMSNFTVNDTRDISMATNYKKWWDNDKTERIKFYNDLGLSKKEVFKIKNGGDVYLPYNRLLELLNGKS